jgi:hypothetical protein
LKTRLPKELKLKRKTKERKSLFSQKESSSENKELPKTKGLKRIERLVRENQKGFPLSILKKWWKDQKLKGKIELKSEKDEN